MHGGSLPSGFLDPGPLVDDDLELVLIAANLADPARGRVAEYCVTCDPDNLPSRRTIERIGGMLQDIIEVEIAPGQRRLTCRYRVSLT